jgi:hypothetical protein
VKLAPSIAGLLLAVACGGVFTARAEATVVPPARTNLLEFLERTKDDLPPVGTTLELAPHWVGTVKRVALRDPRGVYRTDTPDDIRLTHLVVQEDEVGDERLVLARLRWVPGTQLTTVGRDAPAFREQIPAPDRLAATTNVADVMELLGAPDGGGRSAWAASARSTGRRNGPS